MKDKQKLVVLALLALLAWLALRPRGYAQSNIRYAPAPGLNWGIPPNSGFSGPVWYDMSTFQSGSGHWYSVGGQYYVWTPEVTG